MGSTERPYRTIPVREETRDQVRRLKRGGESYDELVARMADQYQPPEPWERGP